MLVSFLLAQLWLGWILVVLGRKVGGEAGSPSWSRAGHNCQDFALKPSLFIMPETRDLCSLCRVQLEWNTEKTKD